MVPRKVLPTGAVVIVKRSASGAYRQRSCALTRAGWFVEHFIFAWAAIFHFLLAVAITDFAVPFLVCRVIADQWIDAFTLAFIAVPALYCCTALASVLFTRTATRVWIEVLDRLVTVWLPSDTVAGARRVVVDCDVSQLCPACNNLSYADYNLLLSGHRAVLMILCKRTASYTAVQSNGGWKQLDARIPVQFNHSRVWIFAMIC